jgi:uncharacterized membrane protein
MQKTEPITTKEHFGTAKWKRARWFCPAVFGAILLVGFILRFYHLDFQSTWRDEDVSICVSDMPLLPMMEAVIADFVHPPLHYILLHNWFALFGFGVVQARALSAIFGLLSIVLIYLLARYLFNGGTGLLAALLLAVSQLGITYSQEARPYAQLLFFVLASTYLFIIALRERKAVAWCGFVAASVLMLYTHYYGGLVLVCLALFAIVWRKRYPIPRLWWTGGMIVLLLAYLPWLSTGVIRLGLQSPKAFLPTSDPSMASHWSSLPAAINWFNNGKFAGINSAAPKWTFPVGGLLFTLPVLLVLKQAAKSQTPGDDERRRREAVFLLAVLWLVPMLAVLGLHRVMIFFHVRYFAFCIAPYYMLVAAGLRLISKRTIIGHLAVAILVVYSIVALRSNYFLPYKANRRDAVNYVASQYKESDCCLFWPPETQQSVPQYWHIYQRDFKGLHTTTLDSIRTGQTGCGRIWLVWDQTRWLSLNKGANREWKRALEEVLIKAEERRYLEAEVSLYIPRKL